MNSKVDKDVNKVELGLVGVRLYEHQRAALKSLLAGIERRQRGFILAHYMGLGKTVTTLAFVVSVAHTTERF